MASKPKKRKVSRSTPPLTREQLLPIPASVAGQLSLQYHMTLVALRQGQGNADLVSILLKAIYVTQYLLDADQLAAHAETFVHTDGAIKALIKTATATDEWRLGEKIAKGSYSSSGCTMRSWARCRSTGLTARKIG